MNERPVDIPIVISVAAVRSRTCHESVMELFSNLKAIIIVVVVVVGGKCRRSGRMIRENHAPVACLHRNGDMVVFVDWVFRHLISSAR